MINLVLLNENLSRQQVLDTFSCSLSKCYYSFENQQAVLSNEARLSISTRTLTFSENCVPGYREKICGYFPSYRVKNEIEIVQELIKDAIDNIPKTYRLSRRTTGTASISNTLSWFNNYSTVQIYDGLLNTVSTGPSIPEAPSISDNTSSSTNSFPF